MVFVAFGVTGDLMRLKILPALFALHSKGDLPERFALIGVSRRDWSQADLRSHIAGAVCPEGFIPPSAEQAPELTSFLQSVFFVKGDAEDKVLYDKLSESFEALEAAWGSTADKVLYLSLSPTIYKVAFEHLRHAPFAQDTKRVRLMIEKPFGTSGKSADRLHTILQNTFEERAIYRVDHYLAKEAMQNVPAVDGTLVSEIHISFFETSGAEKRGAFYDVTGALRDVGQNHMLEMLARVTMEHSRSDAIEALPVISAGEVELSTIRGQYTGYTEIPGVQSNSTTETYFKITTIIDNARFPGVRVVLAGGKGMAENKKEIRITFKDGRILTHTIGENTDRSEYEILIHDCMRGNQTMFVSRREIIALWRFIDPINEGWKVSRTPLIEYAPGTNPAS